MAAVELRTANVSFHPLQALEADPGLASASRQEGKFGPLARSEIAGREDLRPSVSTLAPQSLDKALHFDAIFVE